MVRDPAAIPAPPPKWRCTCCGEETDLVMRLITSEEDYETLREGDWYRAATNVFHVHGGSGILAERITAP